MGTLPDVASANSVYFTFILFIERPLVGLALFMLKQLSEKPGVSLVILYYF